MVRVCCLSHTKIASVLPRALSRGTSSRFSPLPSHKGFSNVVPRAPGGGRISLVGLSAQYNFLAQRLQNFESKHVLKEFLSQKVPPRYGDLAVSPSTTALWSVVMAAGCLDPSRGPEGSPATVLGHSIGTAAFTCSLPQCCPCLKCVVASLR